jgi:hypothetical protein
MVEPQETSDAKAGADIEIAENTKIAQADR